MDNGRMSAVARLSPWIRSRRGVAVLVGFLAMLMIGAAIAATVVGWPFKPQGNETGNTLPDDYIPPRGYVCCRAAGPITVDGKLDDPAWQAAPWTDDFVDIEGDRRPPPR